MGQMLCFLSLDKPNLIAFQSLSSFYDKESHSGLITVCWRKGQESWLWGTKVCSTPSSPCPDSENRNKQNIETHSEKCLMIWTRMSAKQLYFTRISRDKGGLSSAGIHCLWRGLLRGSGNNWPDQVPTLLAWHLCYQNCQVTMGQAQQGGFCQIFLYSCFWFDRFLKLRHKTKDVIYYCCYFLNLHSLLQWSGETVNLL